MTTRGIVLGSLAAQVRERIRNVKGLVDIVDDYDRDLPQIEVRQDVDKAGRYGLRTWDVAGTVRTAAHVGGPLCAMMIDMDRLKQINDTFGHLAGDYVLKEMCKELLKQVRREELLARYGGEEFVVVLPETALSTAATMAEKLRRVVANHHFSFAGKDISITISLGCAELSPMATDPNVFLHEADARLYEAKRAGRNRVVA